jgi:hypothetical protein
VTSHELLSFNVVWLGLQAWELLMWLKARTTTAQFSRAISTALLTAVGSVVGGVVLLTLTGGGCDGVVEFSARFGCVDLHVVAAGWRKQWAVWCC